MRLRSTTVVGGIQVDEKSIVEWATSGAMALTGRADGPPCVAPAVVASSASAAAEDLAAMTSRWGDTVVVDGPALLGERAALAGLTRQGATSAGGACRFVRTADGYVALNLPRPEDVASLPALVEANVAAGDWAELGVRLAALPTAVVIDRATLLGMAASAPASVDGLASPARELARGGPRTIKTRPLVIDLTSLWAGPLAGSLLLGAGARVIKVEGRGRPDGARRGPATFFDLLNRGKEMIEIDFESNEGRGLLMALMARADLVIEASRPRVMHRLGINIVELADAGTSWLSITGYGREGESENRVGFGDDAAVAGGLFVPGGPPLFVADAVADPLTGLAAAAVAAEMLGADRASVVETPLARVSAWAGGRATNADVVETMPGSWAAIVGGERVEVAPPRSRRGSGNASATDADGHAIRLEFTTGR